MATYGLINIARENDLDVWIRPDHVLAVVEDTAWGNNNQMITRTRVVLATEEYLIIDGPAIDVVSKINSELISKVLR